MAYKSPMPSARQGTIRLFRVAGIDVFLHWSWFVVAVFEINGRARTYSSLTFNVLEYLALFLIVLLHEYGHALACRQVGGTADRIVLWPLGGVAYVNPPPRPGATLWSIAAGPLVNVVLVPVLSLLGIVSRSLGWATAMPDFQALLRAIWFMNFGIVDFQHAAHLSLGWRSDSSVAALVCTGARPQFDGRGDHRPRWRGRLRRPGPMDTLCLVWSDLCVHADELLEGTETSASTIAFGKVAASRRI